MSAFQNLPWETTVYLTESGTPVTGVLYSAITVKYKKYAQTSFTTRTLVSADWTELGNGYYLLVWESAFLNILGPFVFTLTGGSFNNQVFLEFDVDPQPASFFAPANTCLVSGNIVDIGGRPSQHNRISFRAPEFPVAIGGSIIDANKVFTEPDGLGNFSVALIQGQNVVVEIDRTGIYAQITIPMASSANLTDLLPPPIG